MRRLFSSVAVLVVLVGGYLLFGEDWPQDAPAPSPSTAAGLTRPPEAEGPFQVARVVDGDTARVLINGVSVSVRLIGIDTPETKSAQKPVQCFGPGASARASELLDGATVWLEYDPRQGRTDRYDRALAFVWVDQVLVNDTLVREGFAHEYTYDGAYTYQATFVDAEADAASQARGLWAADTCAGDTEQAAG
ncbi:thermonuclease family protein [Cellulomonas endometrii]|uniref:thermonuclease family protein n=1 Tax=Cellulomonas endometrii TaxID=3036301 RepID=UPI0024AE3BAB|nr:thermonuclease family protein [Cellulomonas endometrii]